MRNKNKKLNKFIAFSALLSSCCIFSSTKDSNALMKFFRGVRGGFSTNSTRTSKSSTIAGISDSGGKFTPLTPTVPTSSPPQQTNQKINSHTSNGKKSNKSKSTIKLEAKIIASQSALNLNKDYKEILENGIKNSKNEKVKQLLYLDLMSTSTSIGNLEHKNQKLQNKLTKIKNNN